MLGWARGTPNGRTRSQRQAYYPGSDCTRIIIPDLQNIVLEYLLSDALVQYLSAEELLAEAVIAEAQAAE